MSTEIRQYNEITYLPTDMEIYSEQLARQIGLTLPDANKLGRGGRLGTHGRDAAGIVRCMRGWNVKPHLCYSRVFVLPHEYNEKAVPSSELPSLTDRLIRENTERVAQEEIYFLLPYPAGYKHLGLDTLYEIVYIEANRDDRNKIENPGQRIRHNFTLFPEMREIGNRVIESVLSERDIEYDIQDGEYLFSHGSPAYREIFNGLLAAGFREDLICPLRTKAKKGVDKWAGACAWSIASRRAEREGLWEEATEYSKLSSEKFSTEGNYKLELLYADRAQRFEKIAKAWSGLRPF